MVSLVAKRVLHRRPARARMLAGPTAIVGRATLAAMPTVAPITQHAQDQETAPRPEL